MAAVALAGCGGKILEEGTAGGGQASPSPSPSPTTTGISRPTPTTTSTPPSSPPLPPSLGLLTLGEACLAVCERNGRCSAPDLDCYEKCLAEADGRCGADAAAYYQCYGTYLQEGCASLPPRCEPLYCAYTACAGIVQPSYCF